MRPLFRLAAVLAFALSAVAAKADTYQFNQLIVSQQIVIAGMDDNGYVYLSSDALGGTAYLRYFNGHYENTFVVPYSETYTPPADFGVQCSPAGLPPSGSILIAVCNNSRFAAEEYLPTTPGARPTLFTGPPLQVLATGLGGLRLLYINQLGDILFADAFGDSIYEAVDLDTAPVPEPSSIALLATGLLGIGATVRRRSTAP